MILQCITAGGVVTAAVDSTTQVSSPSEPVRSVKKKKLHVCILRTYGGVRKRNEKRKINSAESQASRHPDTFTREGRGQGGKAQELLLPY